MEVAEELVRERGMEWCRNSGGGGGESWRVQLGRVNVRSFGSAIERNWKMTNTDTGAARKQFAQAAYKKRRRSIPMPFSAINQSGSRGSLSPVCNFVL